MSTIIVKNGNLEDKYFETRGTGTELDPHRMVTDVTIQDSTAPLYVVNFSNIVAETTTTSLPKNNKISVIKLRTAYCAALYDCFL